MAVVALTRDHLDAVDAAIDAAGIDPQAARARGDYLTLDADGLLDRLMVNGRVDYGRFHTIATGRLDVAAERGCEIRFCGEVAARLWHAGDVLGSLDMEEFWNTLPATPRFEVRCLHPLDAFATDTRTEVFTALCDLHTEVIPDESYVTLAEPGDRNRMVAHLQQQHRADVRERQRLEAQRVQLAAQCDQLAAQRDELAAQRAQLETDLARCVAQATRNGEQLHRAIESRDVIGQAKGILMARLHVDGDTAFNMLRAASSRSNRKLHVVAESLIHHESLRG